MRHGFEEFTCLAGIRERARILGGSASLRNRPGGGCLLEVVLPLERIDSRPAELPEASWASDRSPEVYTSDMSGKRGPRR